ncbi:MAG: L,D-transpeptidase [Fluviicola sp.]|nr:L,D-transpeptidase [Fluviicola sp.]
MKNALIALSLSTAFLFSCQPPQVVSKKKNSEAPKWQRPATSAYELVNAKEWLLEHEFDSSQQTIAFAVNRTDRSNFAQMDTVVLPIDFSGDIVYYLPFPLEVPYLKDIHKIIFFSYPTQTFATYEHGILMHTGPTNMGREKDATPTGLFYTNWKAEETRSTFNDEWILRWNFNVLNIEGIGWHQYSLPGYPASHSCLRLQEKDAKYLYNWADQWILSDKKKQLLVKGTPVIVFGTYDFSVPKPWLQLVSNPHVLDITEDEITQITLPYLNDILTAQKNRDTHLANTH